MQKRASWTDNLAVEEFTWAEEEEETQPAQVSSLAEIPEDVFGQAEFMDGIELVEEDGTEWTLDLVGEVKSASNLMDHDWLNPTQVQDPDRLPESHFNSVPELEEAWGVNRRTDGLRLVPNRDKEIADYERSLESPPPALPGAEKEAALFHLQRALRLAHYRKPLREIQAYLRQHLGDSHLCRKACSEIESQYGLLGNVYIQASAFPGLKNGKWASELRKTCRNARYVVTEDPLVASKLGMRRVSRVPFEKALRHYLPLLKATGYKVASQGDPQRILQHAFLSGPIKKAVRQGFKPVEVRPADKVSLKEAQRVFSQAPRVAQEVLVRDDTAIARKHVRVTLARMVKAGLLSKEDSFRLGQSKANPVEVRKSAEQLVKLSQAAKSGAFTGPEMKARVDKMRDAEWARLAQVGLDANQLLKAREEVTQLVKAGLLSKETSDRILKASSNPVAIRKAAMRLVRLGLNAEGEFQGARLKAHSRLKETGSPEKAQSELDAGQTLKAQAHVLKMVQAGQITHKEGKISLSQGNPQAALKMATAFANASGTRKLEIKSATPAKEYDGPVLKAAPQYRQAKSLSDTEMHKAARKSGIKVAEFQALATWLRRQMSEGFAGKTLTSLVEMRFASPLRKAARKMVTSLRQEHEGLSGHLYVDAGAYASVTGTAGCEKAASLHRANQVKFVRAMERCSGCVFANAEGFCTKYGKKLLYELPEGSAAFQSEMLRMADAPDHEVTASLFDTREYNLSSPMENLEVESPQVTETLEGVFFGDGMVF